MQKESGRHTLEHAHKHTRTNMLPNVTLSGIAVCGGPGSQYWQVKAEEDSFNTFLKEMEETTAKFEAEKAALHKQYKRQMAQHESAQYNLAAQLTTARSPGCQFFDLSAPPPPFMPQFGTAATIEDDP